jgi:hypothetical protein
MLPSSIKYNEEEILEHMSYHLRVHVVSHMYKDLVAGVTYFRDKTPEFIAAVVPFLHALVIQPSEFIIRPMGIIKEMYFLRSGEAKVLLPLVPCSPSRSSPLPPPPPPPFYLLYVC